VCLALTTGSDGHSLDRLVHELPFGFASIVAVSVNELVMETCPALRGVWAGPDHLEQTFPHWNRVWIGNSLATALVGITLCRSASPVVATQTWPGCGTGW